MVNDELDSIPSITLDKEDLDRHLARPKEGNFSKPVFSPPRLVSGGLSRVSTGFWMLVGGVLLLGGVAIYQWQTAHATRERLQEAEQRLDQLESRFINADTEITKSGLLLAEKLKSMEQQVAVNKDEIRKLWGLAGDTQRRAIESLKSSTARQELSLKELREMADSDHAINAQQNTRLEDLSASVQVSEASAREAAQRAEFMQEKVMATDIELKNIKQKQTQLGSDYGKRLTALEDTAKSTDVFRRNTQDELRKLREEILKSESAAPAP